MIRSGLAIGFSYCLFVVSVPSYLCAQTTEAPALETPALKVLNPPLTCDATKCKTQIREVHADGNFAETGLEIVFPPPNGVTLEDSHKGEVEIEGSGATHYVKALGGGPSWLKCKWFAASKFGGDNGLAKGYCWISKK